MNWLTKISGQAIQVTQEMRDFARETADTIANMTDEQFQEGWKSDLFSKVGHFLVYKKAFDYKNYKLAIYVGIAPESDAKGAAGRAKILENPSNIITGRILLYMDSPKRRTSGTLYYTILHELVHLIDPKIDSGRVDRSKWKSSKTPRIVQLPDGTYKPSTDYYTKPSEIDAYMAEFAERIVDNYKYTLKLDKATALENIKYRSPHPQLNSEQSWYKNPKIWRKYMNTLYQAIERAYSTE